jgi:hypothetical protein
MEGLLTAIAQHDDYFWAAIFLAPSVLLMDFGMLWHGIQRFRDYSVPVEADIVDVIVKRGRRTNVYRPVYSLFYNGETLTLPDVSWRGFRYPRSGAQRTVRINPIQPDAVFDPKTYWIRMALWIPAMLLFTVFALSGLTM